MVSFRLKGSVVRGGPKWAAATDDSDAHGGRNYDAVQSLSCGVNSIVACAGTMVFAENRQRRRAALSRPDNAFAAGAPTQHNLSGESAP
jgi:hypothetical protein